MSLTSDLRMYSVLKPAYLIQLNDGNVMCRACYMAQIITFFLPYFAYFYKIYFTVRFGIMVSTYKHILKKLCDIAIIL